MEVVAATSAVAGIVRFGLQIYQVLLDFASKVAQADQCIQALIIDIKLTTSALENVQKLLEKEEHLRKTKEEQCLFSDDAVGDIKGTAEHCFGVFKAIVSIISKDGKKGKFQATASADSNFQSRLNDEVLLTKLEGVNWAFVQDKVKLQTMRLQDLILLFSAVHLKSQHQDL